MRVACEEGKLSERRACGLVGIARGSVRYERRQRDDRALRALMKELAAKRPRFGYRRLHVLLRREKKEDGTIALASKSQTCVLAVSRRRAGHAAKSEEATAE